MTKTCYPLPGYAHLYRSLVRFLELETTKAKELIYILNTANLDSYSYHHNDKLMSEISKGAFFRFLDKDFRPYHTEVQLYKAMYALCCNIDMECLTSGQRESVLQLKCLMNNLNYRFYQAFGYEVDGLETTYLKCNFGLIPSNDEPSCCLL